MHDNHAKPEPWLCAGACGVETACHVAGHNDQIVDKACNHEGGLVEIILHLKATKPVLRSQLQIRFNFVFPGCQGWRGAQEVVEYLISA